jgi:hypothetical protein
MTLTIRDDDVSRGITATGSEIVRRVFSTLAKQHNVEFQVGSPAHDPPDGVCHRIEQQKRGWVGGIQWQPVMDVVVTPFSFGPSDKAMKITATHIRTGHDVHVFDELDARGLQRLEEGLMFQVNRIHSGSSFQSVNL